MTQQYNPLATASQTLYGIGAHTPAVFSTNISLLDCAIADFRSKQAKCLRLPAMWLVALVVMFVSLVATAVAQEPVVEALPASTQAQGLSIEGWIRGGTTESLIAINRTMSVLSPMDSMGHFREFSGKTSSRVASRGSEMGGGLTLTYAIDSRLDVRAGIGFTTRKTELSRQEIDRYAPKIGGDSIAVDVAWSARSTQIVSSIALQVHVPHSGIVLSVGPTARISISDSVDVPSLTYRSLEGPGERNPLFDTEVPMKSDPADPVVTAPVQWSVSASLGYELSVTDRLTLAPRIMVDVGVSKWHSGAWIQGRSGGVGQDSTALAIEEAPCSVAGSLGVMWRF